MYLMHTWDIKVCIFSIVLLYEPRYDKTNKKNVRKAQRRLRSAWASAQSDQSLRCALIG